MRARYVFAIRYVAELFTGEINCHRLNFKAKQAEVIGCFTKVSFEATPEGRKCWGLRYLLNGSSMLES